MTVSASIALFGWIPVVLVMFAVGAATMIGYRELRDLMRSEAKAGAARD